MLKRTLLGLAAGVGLGLAPMAALAQSDIVGEWAQKSHEDSVERGAGPDIGEYAGMPVNKADLAHADAWQASLLTVPEHQCFPHPTDYGPSFTGVRIWKDVDPVTQNVIAYHTNIGWMNPVRTIWMDGRAHPPEEALHTWEGFSTGKWEGDVLTVTTTHLKTGYVKRNGLARSDKSTVVEHFIRVGNYLTWVTVVNDPVYLTEPLIRSRNYLLDPGYQVTLYPCSTDVEVERPEGKVPHYLPGTNPALEEYAKAHNMPMVAVRGGADSMYPEFQKKLTVGYNGQATASAAPATPAKPAKKGGAK